MTPDISEPLPKNATPEDILDYTIAFVKHLRTVYFITNNETYKKAADMLEQKMDGQVEVGAA